MSGLPIFHVDLAHGPETLQVEVADCLVVFWYGDVPIGQVRSSGAIGRSVDLWDLQRAVVDPAVLARARELDAARMASDPDNPSASIVICTRDRPDDLAVCLASLRDQTRQPLEVIVVDNASSDDLTREVTLAAGVIYVREDRAGLDFARNAGVRAARGKIIAFTDDDVRLHPRWLERMLVAFDHPSIMAVTGLVLPAQLDTAAQVHFETFWSFGRGFRRIDFGQDFRRVDRTRGYPAWEIGAGASMAFRSEVFSRIGGFDERLDVGRAGCSGDSEYWHRVLTHGGICRYEPSVVAFHVHRREMKGLASQIFYYMRGHAAALLVQYERSGNSGNLRRVLFTMPLWYARRVVRSLVRGRQQSDLLLKQEIRGFVSGVSFYLRTYRSHHKQTRRGAQPIPARPVPHS